MRGRNDGVEVGADGGHVEGGVVAVDAPGGGALLVGPGGRLDSATAGECHNFNSRVSESELEPGLSLEHRGVFVHDGVRVVEDLEVVVLGGARVRVRAAVHADLGQCDVRV